MNSFRSHWNELAPDGRDALARSCQTTPAYLYMIALGHKTPGPALARRVSDSTGIPLHLLRPDIWDEAASKRKRRA